jgi:hypothetical protein
MGEENVYRNLVGKEEGQTPLKWPNRKWGDNIKKGHMEIGLGGVDKI